jgi:hypothetical protein
MRMRRPLGEALAELDQQSPPSLLRLARARVFGVGAGRPETLYSDPESRAHLIWLRPRSS